MNQWIIFMNIFIPLITYIISQELTEITSDSINIEKTICNLNIDCNSCFFCGDKESDYSTCSYENLFCQSNEKYYKYNSSLTGDYSRYFRNQVDIDSFCGTKSIELNSMTDSFKIFEHNINTQSSSQHFHCDYGITNNYYYNHDQDKAKLIIEIKSLSKGVINNSKKIRFNIFMIYTYGDSLKFNNLTDNAIREFMEYRFVKSLDSISLFELLIDFTNDNPITTEESLIITIETKNPSKKTRLIYIIVLVICCFLVLLIIALIIIYVYIKRKMDLYYRENRENRENDQNERLEKEEKIKKNKELIKQLFEHNLAPKIFTKDIILNNCENCSICLEAFECGKSSICITFCKHIFHYDCLKKWIDDNVLTPKCPNCNYNLINNLLQMSKINVDKKNKEPISNNENIRAISILQNSHIRENENNEQINNEANSRDNLNINNHNNG